LDVGTTVLKVVAFGARSGSVLGEVRRRVPVSALEDGGRETPVGALHRAIESAVSELRARIPSAWRRITGVGLASQGGSSIIADRTTGKALTSMMLWSDLRGRPYLERIERESPKGLWRRHVLSDHAPAGLGRLLWLREARPELFTDEHIHVGGGELVLFRLTGIWRQDAGNAVQIGSFSSARGRLVDSLLRRIGVPLSFFAPLRVGHETSPLSEEGARLLGLPEGTPVAGPYIDQEAGYLAAAAASRRPLDCSLGTAWVGNFVLPEGISGRAPLQLVIPSPLQDGRLVILPLPAGNAAWEWALRELLRAPPRKALERAARVLEGAPIPAGLASVPWLAGPNPVAQSLQGGAAFVGVGADTRHEDLFRAFAAGMAFELVRGLSAVRDAGLVEAIVLSGGTSRSGFFRNVLATLFEPIPCFHREGEASSAARGALYAFSRKAAGGGLRRARPPRREIADGIHRSYERYLDAFEMVHGSAPSARAFEVRGSPT
jgi:sugar (pentulose or hexulose) kinase